MPTGWVYLKSDCTVRWQRGDREAFVLKGNKIGSWTREGLLGKIPVAEVRLIGEKWVRAK
ncbi:MAG: hypothetical protein ACRDSL_23310 [Pseudonocardiaceae bacterium]